MSTASRRRIFVVAAALMSGLGVRGPARANGDDFFDYIVPEGPIEKQIIYYGSVKDDKGNLLNDATITISVTVPEEFSAEPVTYNAYTNIVGRFRTMNATSIVASLLGVEVELDRANVALTAEKEGYKMLRKLNRGRSGKLGPVELNFVMAKVS